MKKKDIRIRCWIDIDGVKFFGPGRAELLERIDQEGAIAKAAKKMGNQGDQYNQGCIFKRMRTSWHNECIGIANQMKKAAFVIVLVLLSASSHAQQNNMIRIAAASNLKFALDSMVKAFKAVQPGRVDVSYGSSGKLFEQISNGAPFDIFFSADTNYPALLREKDMAISEPYMYAVGRIVVWSKKMDVRKDGIRSLLDPGVKKIAIANPLYAPYGKRAEEALAYYGIRDQVKGKLVYGQNISQTAQFVTSGAADAGIIALSLALSPNMQRENGGYFMIPDSSHRSLEQGVVITRHGRGNEFAKAFMEFVKGELAGGILQYFGFMRPQP